MFGKLQANIQVNMCIFWGKGTNNTDKYTYINVGNTDKYTSKKKYIKSLGKSKNKDRLKNKAKIKKRINIKK